MKKNKATNIIILCGGMGKRMGRFTKKIPKPLLKVGKIPIIEHKIHVAANTNGNITKLISLPLTAKIADPKTIVAMIEPT